MRGTLVRTLLRTLVPCLLVSGTLHAQQQPDAHTTADRLPGRVVDVAAGEFFFQAPDSIPAGLTTFRLRQIGLVHHRAIAGGAARDSGAADRGDQTRGFHMLWLVRLEGGRTMADFHRAIQAREPTPWARNLGGPGFAMPPATTNATLALEPGSYLLTCFVGSAREDRTRYHLLNGMVRALTVLPARAAAAPAPTPDLVVRVGEDGAVQFSAPLEAGRRVIRVENAGATPYEFLVRRVLPGRTAAEALAWRQRDGPSTPVPFEPIGGLSDVPAGGSLVTTMTFEPGDYFVGVGAGARFPFTVPPARARPGAEAPVRAVPNDNRVAAGATSGRTLLVRLVARRVTWHPGAEDGPSKVVEAFAEAGEAPRVPGTLIRVSLGTTIGATVASARAGTFIYHTHVTDHAQLSRGLYGALLVVPAADVLVVRIENPTAPPGVDDVSVRLVARP